MQRVPFTSGILIGIGETRLERIESLLALRDLHDRYGHLQELIVQNFRAKPGTRMAGAPEPDLEDLRWTIAVARVLFGPEMNIQAPPNLSPDTYGELIGAGLNDWGGVSPVTPDHVNPEAPWPHLGELARRTADAGKVLSSGSPRTPRTSGTPSGGTTGCSRRFARATARLRASRSLVPGLAGVPIPPDRRRADSHRACRRAAGVGDDLRV